VFSIKHIHTVGYRMDDQDLICALACLVHWICSHVNMR
jgi:hypothetical protein